MRPEEYNKFVNPEPVINDKPLPKWFWYTLAAAFFYVVIVCGVSGFQTTETAMKLEPRTYTSFSDYQAFVDDNQVK